MKYSPYLIVIILTAVVMFLLMKSCSKEGDLLSTVNNLKEDLQSEQLARGSAEVKIASLQKAVDSLAILQTESERQQVVKEREIDENISKDSSNSINEYRKALAENNETVDNSGKEPLTFREIGLGAKYISRVPKLQLQINTCEEQLILKDEIIADNNFIKKSYEQSLKIQKLETLEWQKAYDNATAWYHEDWLWLTLGVVVTGGIVAVIGVTN